MTKYLTTVFFIFQFGVGYCLQPCSVDNNTDGKFDDETVALRKVLARDPISLSYGKKGKRSQIKAEELNVLMLSDEKQEQQFLEDPSFHVNVGLLNISPPLEKISNSERLVTLDAIVRRLFPGQRFELHLQTSAHHHGVIPQVAMPLANLLRNWERVMNSSVDFPIDEYQYPGQKIRSSTASSCDTLLSADSLASKRPQETKNNFEPVKRRNTGDSKPASPSAFQKVSVDGDVFLVNGATIIENLVENHFAYEPEKFSHTDRSVSVASTAPSCVFEDERGSFLDRADKENDMSYQLRVNPKFVTEANRTPNRRFVTEAQVSEAAERIIESARQHTQDAWDKLKPYGVFHMVDNDENEKSLLYIALEAFEIPKDNGIHINDYADSLAYLMLNAKYPVTVLADSGNCDPVFLNNVLWSLKNADIYKVTSMAPWFHCEDGMTKPNPDLTPSEVIVFGNSFIKTMAPVVIDIAIGETKPEDNIRITGSKSGEKTFSVYGKQSTLKMFCSLKDAKKDPHVKELLEMLPSWCLRKSKDIFKFTRDNPKERRASLTAAAC